LSNSRIRAEEAWVFKPDDRVVRMALSSETNWAILADQARNVYVLDDAGKLQWQAQLDLPILGVAAGDRGGLFICLLQDGTLVAFGRIGAERLRGM